MKFEIFQYVRDRNLLGGVATVTEFLNEHSFKNVSSAWTRFSHFVREGEFVALYDRLDPEARLYLRRRGIRQVYALASFADRIDAMQFRDLNARVLFPDPFLAKKSSPEVPTELLPKTAPMIQSIRSVPAEPVIQTLPVERRPRHNPQPQAQERVRLPRILVVGLLPAQQQVLKKEFEGVYQLSFLKKDGHTGMEEVVRAGRFCDLVIFHTDHIAHTTLAAQKKLSNVLLVPGSTTTLVSRLRQMRLNVH